MDKLINMVSERIGVDHDKAQTAVQTVLGFLKERLPAPLASKVDGAIGGDDTEESGKRDEGGLGSRLGL